MQIARSAGDAEASMLALARDGLDRKSPRDLEGGGASWSPLVPLRSSGSRPALFCLPGNLGDVHTDLGHLARHLGPDQPFYGLQDSTENPVKIEAVATYYLQWIRDVQPSGPYLMGGICSGGVVAFEMAQQLVAQGERIALLALVEPAHPRVPGVGIYQDYVSYLGERIRYRLTHRSKSAPPQGDTDQWAFIRLKAKVAANVLAVRRYAAQPYSGRIHVFWSEGSIEREPQEHRLVWQTLALGGIECHTIPGTHDSITGNNDTPILESEMRELARQLRSCIDEALTA